MRHIKCYVTPQDHDLWCSLCQRGAEHAQDLEMACAILQRFQTNLPKQVDGSDLRELSWLEKAIECMATAAQLLRTQT